MKIFNIIILSTLFAAGIFAQNSGVWIDPNRSDPNLRRNVVMNSNRVETITGNWFNVGQSGDFQELDGVWPKGSRHPHIWEFTGLVAAEVPDTNGNRVPIIANGYIDLGREADDLTNIGYKVHPVPGYFNDEQGQNEYANSINKLSWPMSWPGKDGTWNGKWNGFFGQNQFNSDQEAMYYIDDTWDKESAFFPFPEDLLEPLPDPGDPTYLEKYKAIRGGLGVQVQVRLFQWNHPLAQDILFFYFEISNAGEFDYNLDQNPIIFGGFGDIGPGGPGTVDDDGDFDKEVDMIYGWDHDGILHPNWQVNEHIPIGFLGWKFLESPGLIDFIDNDDDGLIDERRDNDAGMVVFGPVGIYGDEKEHFEGDEDGDWDPNEDDVGADGISKYDEGYDGPDADGTEENGIPDQGEPDFGRLDNDESDQIGLTSASNPVYSTSLNPSNEEILWNEYLQPVDEFPEPTVTENQFWIFGSGPVELKAGNTERFSTCYVFAFTEDQLFRSAQVAQNIFDSDYRFSKPPRQPFVTAVPGDGKVTLMWDKRAETSYDPIYGHDFEGYRVYKSTDPQFLDVNWVTDSYGTETYRIPLAIYDIENGLYGPHSVQIGEEVGEGQGIHYNLGSDSGLRHYYVDTDVINGRTYYYAVTSYDRGHDSTYAERGLAEEKLLPMSPSECASAITETDGIITRQDPNTAIVTPNPISHNYLDGYLETGDTLVHSAGIASGSVIVSIVEESLLEDGEYEVSFKSIPGKYAGETWTTLYSVYKVGDQDTLVKDAEVPRYYADNLPKSDWDEELFDKGIRLQFDNRYPDAKEAEQQSGWTNGSQTNYEFEINKFVELSSKLPVSFVLEFGDTSAVLDTAVLNSTGSRVVGTNFKVYDYYTGDPVNFRIFNDGETNGTLEPEDQIIYYFKDPPDDRRFKSSWAIKFKAPLDIFGNPIADSLLIPPQDGDVFICHVDANFTEDDLFTFSTVARKLRENLNKDILADIKVVPNPYIVSSRLEQAPYASGRGERFIRFINLPEVCTIKIFTVNGDLVRTLQHNSDQGAIRWDLISKDNLEVAFGLYVYHVEAPGIGEKIGKFAIIN